MRSSFAHTRLHCRILPCVQAREASVSTMTLLAGSDAHAEHHADLVSRRPNLRAMSLLRWAQWQCCEKGPDGMPKLRLLQAPQWERTDAALDSLPPALRSLVLGVFVLTSNTSTRLKRCATTVMSAQLRVG